MCYSTSMSVMGDDVERTVIYSLRDMFLGSMLLRFSAFWFLQLPKSTASMLIPFWVSFFLLFCRGAQSLFKNFKNIPAGWREFLVFVYIWALISLIFTVAIIVDLAINGLCLDIDCFVPSNSPRYWLLNLMLFA